MREPQSGTVARSTMHLAALLTERRSEIVDRWLKAGRAGRRARSMTLPALVDHMSSLLDDIAVFADGVARRGAANVPDHDTVARALRRIEAGFDLQDVIREYGELRRAILELLDTGTAVLYPGELTLLNRALDAAVGQAVSAYATAQQRVLRALDRVSEATRSATDPEEMLSRLLDVFMDVAAPVDTVTLLLREGDVFRVRASVGLDQAQPASPVKTGDSFAQAVARERRPLAINDVQHNPGARDEWSPASGLKTLYGVPLLHEDAVIGVAHMGSHAASAFSEEQQLLFRAFASRATMLIAQGLAMAREQSANITSQALAASATLEEAAARLLAGMSTAFGWDTALYWQVVPERGVLRYQGGWTAPGAQFPAFHAASRSLVFAPGEGLPGRAWQSGGVEWIHDLGDDPDFPRLASAIEGGLRRAMALPLSTGEEILGVIEFFGREPVGSTEAAVQMTSVIAQQLPEFLRRIRAQQMVRQSETRYSAMLDVALDCIISMDAHGVVTTWNPAAERTFGFSAQEAVGHDLATLIIPPDLRDAHRAGLARYLSTRQERVFNRRIEMPALRRDGTRMIVELAITKIPVDGPPLFTAFLRDITELMETQREQKRLVAEAQDATRARETLLAIVSHDLRNPLAAIMAGAGLLLRKTYETADDTTRRSLQTVLRAASKMDRLIADLLDTSSIQVGRLSMDRRLQPLAAIVSDAQHLHQPLAADKGIRLTFEIELIDVECLCDRDRILQVLSNLLSNALRFCGAGDSIQVWATALDTQAIIEIADTGPGIPQQDLPRIFEPYFSGHGAKQSTGLGLFISRGIIEAHGGQLWAHSGPGPGTTFRFTLPVTMGEDEP